MVEATATIGIESLWESFYNELLAFARTRLGSDSEAEDILQVAFLRAHNQLESGMAPTNTRAWLYQIVRNLVIDTYRRNARRRDTTESEGVLDLELVEDKSSFNVDEDTRAIVARALPRFIEKLRDPYREALQLTEIEGLTQAEAAARAGLSLSGMKSRVQRARKQLLESLHQCCKFVLDARHRVVAWESHTTDETCSSSPDCVTRE